MRRRVAGKEKYVAKNQFFFFFVLVSFSRSHVIERCVSASIHRLSLSTGRTDGMEKEGARSKSRTKKNATSTLRLFSTTTAPSSTSTLLSPYFS